MEWSLLAQGGLNGVMLGVNYALIALGLTLIFGILGIVNFTHGEMYMLGGYVAYYFFGHFGLNFFATLALSAVLVGALGVILEKFIFRPLTKRPKLELTSLIAAVGLAWVFQMLAIIAFGDLDKNVPSAFKGILRMSGVVITVERLATIIIGLCLVVLLNVFLLKSKTGMTIRAVAQDKEAAALQGVSVDRITALTFGIGCGLAAISGALIAPIFGISPNMGGEVILKAFLVVILGGMGSVPGAMLGGLVLGFVESFGCLFFSVPTVMVLTFSIIILILILKPKGLLGHA
ncbi:MAG: branched-chain amino acid ABC transporter permease [Syntrophaceae bacterium]|nr:branched-chain amino acid ABC transporter permease [Syntrophaceae bacterium]